MAEYCLQNNGVVYGVALNGNIAEYIRIDSEKDIFRIQGSKYVQAKVGNICSYLIKDIKDNRKVVFSGTPCVVAGVKNLIATYKLDDDGVTYIDILCHGTPSPEVFKEYLCLRGIDNAEDCNFNFRDKTYGWEPHICSYKKDNISYFDEFFARLFISDISFNECCYECQYATLNRVGDITLGDCWNISNIQFEFNDHLGVSLVFVNNKKGIKLIEAVSGKEKKIQIDDVNQIMQLNLKQPTKRADKYKDFWKLALENGYREAFDLIDDGKLLNEKIACNVSEYNRCVKYLHETKIERIHLYGIGVTMLQFMQFLLAENQIQVVGLTGRDISKKKDNIFGIPIVEANMIAKDEYIVICTKKESVSSIIKDRLKNIGLFDNMKIISISDFCE